MFPASLVSINLASLLSHFVQFNINYTRSMAVFAEITIIEALKNVGLVGVISGLTEQILLNNIQEPKYNIQTGLLYKTNRLNITHKVSTR